MADFEVDDDTGTAEEADQAALPYLIATEPEDTIMRTRTYDLSISYDKYYQARCCCSPPPLEEITPGNVLSQPTLHA